MIGFHPLSRHHVLQIMASHEREHVLIGFGIMRDEDFSFLSVKSWNGYVAMSFSTAPRTLGVRISSLVTARIFG
jgi:hypothetical protein